MNTKFLVIAALVLGIAGTVLGLQNAAKYADLKSVGNGDLAGDITFTEGGGLVANSVTTGIIVDGAVEAGDLATSAVTTAKILDGTIVAADLDDRLVKYTTVTLASSSFGELATTSLQLLAAPSGGAGYVNQIVSVTGFRVFSSESWNNQNANAPSINYSYQNIPITASLSKGFFSGNASGSTASPSYAVVNPAVAYRAASNSAVVLRRVGAVEPTIDGDTYFKFDILYRIIQLP